MFVENVLRRSWVVAAFAAIGLDPHGAVSRSSIFLLAQQCCSVRAESLLYLCQLILKNSRLLHKS